MRQHRPEGFRGAGDAHLLSLSRELQKVLLDTQRLFSNGTLRLRKTEVAKLADVLVEFAEDRHNETGIWDAYERYNAGFFGAPVPFSTTDRVTCGLDADRIRHLLWVLYPQLKPGLILSPHHPDLTRLAHAAQACLADAFKTVPKGSGVKGFLETPNHFGWDVKRKLVWLGTCSYMFRLFFHNYLDEHNRGRWDIGHADDFLCQECTP